MMQCAGLTGPCCEGLDPRPGHAVTLAPSNCHGKILRSCTIAHQSVQSTPCVQKQFRKRKHVRLAVRASKGKVADYDGSNGEDEEEWVPKFVQENKPRFEEDIASPQIAPEDPASVEKAKEKFWGRIAVISLGAVLLSERLSGRGIVTALNMATGVPVWEIEPALGLVVGALLAAGIYPVIRRMGSRVEQGQNPLSEPGRDWKDSFQVATGRLAFVALAGTILAEATTGKGILAILNVETGVEITEIEAGLTFLLLLLFTEDMKASK